ncbi:MAG: response regulator transcription factor [Clostridia bacterium]|nr:response regulator transcription factor [Clostridia bacterium]
MKNILIIDDDIHIGNLLEKALTDEGYGVMRAYSGTEAIYVLSQSKPDLVLLDLMLPGLSGEEVLTHIKNIPVIVLSAKIDVDNKIGLLRGGAVDYVTKPFHVKELSARIAAQLRIFDSLGKAEVLSFDGIELDTSAHCVTVNGVEIKPTRTEYAILKLLMRNKTKVVPKSLLLERVSEDTPDCTESSLKTHISNLRKKLREASGKDYLEAVWGIGFRLKSE